MLITHCASLPSGGLIMLTSRRSLLGSILAGTAGGALAAAGQTATAADPRRTLVVESRQFEIAGKAAKRYRVIQASGAFGLTLNEGDEFNVRLENGLAVPTGVHLHGLTESWRQDGVPFLTAPPIA